MMTFKQGLEGYPERKRGHMRDHFRVRKQQNPETGQSV